MNENSLREMALRETPWNTIMTELITDYCFINIGTIKNIHNDIYVDVNFYYGKDGPVDLIDVRLLQLGTTKCKIFIKPEIGDNVLLLCPKDLIEKIEFNKERGAAKGLFRYYAKSNMCGILIKDESDDNVLTSININEDGDVDFSTQGLISASQIDDQGEEKASVKVDADGNIAIKSEKNIHLNGGESESHLVRYEELQQGLNALWTAIQTHTHLVSTTGTAEAQSGTAAASLDLSTKTLDISKAKIDTILTEQASAT